MEQHPALLTRDRLDLAEPVAQYLRIDLQARPRYAVCANGGVLLVDGVPDRRWADHVRRAEGLFLYALVDPARRPEGWAEELARFCAARGWRTSAREEKVYALPAELSKTAAVAEVRRRVAADRLLAAGDSFLDVDLLLGADAAIRPAHGELHDAGWCAEHVAVTSTTGIRAGEDIAHWLLARAGTGALSG